MNVNRRSATGDVRHSPAILSVFSSSSSSSSHLSHFHSHTLQMKHLPLFQEANHCQNASVAFCTVSPGLQRHKDINKTKQKKSLFLKLEEAERRAPACYEKRYTGPRSHI